MGVAALEDTMRKYFGWALASAILVGFSAVGGAMAADMAVKARPVAPPVVIYNWSGCYIGGNVGGGWKRNTLSSTTTFLGTPVAFTDLGSDNGSSVIGGAQIGCDYQFAGNWVAGIQGMFDFGNIDSSHQIPGFPTFVATSRVKDIFSVTGRVGYLFTPQLLGYVKGGGAWASTNQSILGPANAVVEFASNNRSGWTVGGGLEYMFAPGWSVFGEYNYMDFGHRTLAFAASPGFVFTDTLSSHLTVQQALVGVNYKFNWGWGGAPVAARY
jgi:outer membrane immunogenic protein